MKNRKQDGRSGEKFWKVLENVLVFFKEKKMFKLSLAYISVGTTQSKISTLDLEQRLVFPAGGVPSWSLLQVLL